jgi:hypothetical protein
MRCVVHPGLDKQFIEQQVEEVLERLKGEEGLDFTFVFIEDKTDLSEIVGQLDLDTAEREIFTARVRKEGSSNFSIDNEDFLIIDIDERFLEENPSALRGLLAHELMHTVHREEELEDDIQRAAVQRSDHIIQQLADRGYTKDEAMRFFRQVVSTAVFCLKDLIGNAELIEQGFAGDLEEYYYQMLDIDDYCPLPRFYSEEEKLTEIEEAISFELELMPAWVPFVGMDRERADEIRDRIGECYQQNIPETSHQMGKIADSFEQREDNEAFIDTFFDQVIKSALEVIDAKLQG